MTPRAAPRFVRDRQALDHVLSQLKQMPCPHCHRAGMLVGHGLLSGYAERGSEPQVRGRRLLCSARFHHKGCGRTFSVLIATVVAGFMARTPTLCALLEAVVGGLSRKAAWKQVQACSGGIKGLCLRSGYRLWARLLAAQSRIRTALCALRTPPANTDARPIAQMLAHLRHALGETGCVRASFQLALQQGVFG